jgi:hypothetical protein
MSDREILEGLHGQVHGDPQDSAVTVSGGPTLLPEENLVDRKFILIQHQSGGDVYIGGQTVSAGTGYKLSATEEVRLPLGRAQLYGMCPTGSGTVAIVEFP